MECLDLYIDYKLGKKLSATHSGGCKVSAVRVRYMECLDLYIDYKLGKKLSATHSGGCKVSAVRVRYMHGPVSTHIYKLDSATYTRYRRLYKVNARCFYVARFWKLFIMRN